jgi:hypothetical protein
LYIRLGIPTFGSSSMIPQWPFQSLLVWHLSSESRFLDWTLNLEKALRLLLYSFIQSAALLTKTKLRLKTPALSRGIA